MTNRIAARQLRILEACDAADRAVLAQRKADAPLKPAKPQVPCDVGLFSDDASQLDLVDMFMD